MSTTIVLTGVILAFALFAAVLGWADYTTTSPKAATRAKSAERQDQPRALAASG
jgi:hypothetical protein